VGAGGVSALLGRRHFGLTVRILAQINVVCQEGLGCFENTQNVASGFGLPFRRANLPVSRPPPDLPASGAGITARREPPPGGVWRIYRTPLEVWGLRKIQNAEAQYRAAHGEVKSDWANPSVGVVRQTSRGLLEPPTSRIDATNPAMVVFSQTKGSRRMLHGCHRAYRAVST
jgi:hypothetical protein